VTSDDIRRPAGPAVASAYGRGRPDEVRGATHVTVLAGVRHGVTPGAARSPSRIANNRMGPKWETVMAPDPGGRGGGLDVARNAPLTPAHGPATPTNAGMPEIRFRRTARPRVLEPGPVPARTACPGSRPVPVRPGCSCGKPLGVEVLSPTVRSSRFGESQPLRRPAAAGPGTWRAIDAQARCARFR